MKPDVSIQAILDELVVLKLVSSHVDGVVAASALEVEHHGWSQLVLRSSAKASSCKGSGPMLGEFCICFAFEAFSRKI